MVSHDRNISELWKELPWKKFRVNLFRLQKRVFKAVQVKDMRKARSLQKLILKSKSARLLAIRQVTQLNAGKTYIQQVFWAKKYLPRKSEGFRDPILNSKFFVEN